MINYDGLPESLHGGMRRYIEDHIETGGFLRAVLSNDLRLALVFADSDNLRDLYAIVSWVYNEAPGNCWGSPAKVAAWIAR